MRQVLLLVMLLIFPWLSSAEDKKSISQNGWDLNAAHFCYYGSANPYSAGSHIKMQDGLLYECSTNRLDVSAKGLVWNLVVESDKRSNAVGKINTLDHIKD